jgi:hypothetical protein
MAVVNIRTECQHTTFIKETLLDIKPHLVPTKRVGDFNITLTNRQVIQTKNQPKGAIDQGDLKHLQNILPSS